VDPTHQLQGVDPIEDDAASDNNLADNIEQSSSMTEEDDDVVLVESDDPFFEDPKHNDSKILKKLDTEVRFFSLPLLTM